MRVWRGNVLLTGKYVFLVRAFPVCVAQGYSRGRTAAKTSLLCLKYLIKLSDGHYVL